MASLHVGIRPRLAWSTRAARGSARRSRPSCWRSPWSPASAWLLALQAIVFALGAAGRPPYGVLYARLVRPRLGPPAELEDTRPLRFAQAVGLVFALVALAGLALSTSAVTALFTAAALAAAFLNAAFGICLGCEVYLCSAAPPARHPSPARSPTTAPPTPARRSTHETENREQSWSTPTGSRPTSTTRRSCSSRSTRTPPPTTRTTSGAPSGSTGRRTCRTRSAATSSSKEQFEALLSAKGIGNDDTVVLYGGNNNWFAAYAYWYFKLYGHDDVRLLDGGRKKWELDSRELVEPTSPSARRRRTRRRTRTARSARSATRSRRPSARRTWSTSARPTSSPASCSPPRTCRRSSRSGPATSRPRANIPWSQAANDDGTFKSDDELTALYAGKGVDLDKDTIAYCRIGERSAHTWFVLHELLGQPNVKNYDGSWTEWGSLVGVPIELGEQP